MKRGKSLFVQVINNLTFCLFLFSLVLYETFQKIKRYT